MRTFYMVKNRDAGNFYFNALIRAGYVEESLEKADMIFTDFERPMLKGHDKPVFIYPHTPYSYWLWDRWVNPLPVVCNFVASDEAKKGMADYGYPYRVEVCGFPRCPVKEFEPTAGRNLLYASAHLLGTKKIWPPPGDREMHLRAMRWIARNRNCFDRVVVYYSVSLERNDLTQYTNIGIEFVELGDHKDLSASKAMGQFEGIDLVISCNTLAYISIALGIPTIMFGFEKNAPHRSSTGFGRHYDLYKSHYEFPISLEEMSGIDAVRFCHGPNSKVEEWKRNNIGGPFDAEKFISIVGET